MCKIICIEGTDCSGKETQSNELIKRLEQDGLKVKKYSFPIYELPSGRIVGDNYLGKSGKSYFEEGAPNVDPIISSLYFAANRREAFLKIIENDLNKYDIIILDRYTTSNLGHQGGKGKTKLLREKICDTIIKLEFDLCELPNPDAVIFLHMPYEATIELKKNREILDDNEKSPKHLKDAERSYLEICKKYNWDYISCIKGRKYTNIEDIKTIKEINDEVYDVIRNLKFKKSSYKKMTKY